MTNTADATPLRPLWLALAAAMVAFHLGLIFWGLVPNLVSRPLHLAFVLPWVFVYGAKSRVQSVSGLILAALGVSAALWIALNHNMLGDQYGFLENNFQLGIAVVLLVCVIEAARRAIGWPLPLVATLALAYALLGQYIPGEFGHSGTPLNSFLGTMTIAEGGIWGSLTAVSVGVVSIFVIFGAVLNAGDGKHEHPTQALLDALTIRRAKGRLQRLSIAICGDIAHSRVARSNIMLLGKMENRIRLIAPPTLMPSGVADFGVEVFENMEEGLKDVDVVMMLRLQKERMDGGFIPSEREYFHRYGLDATKLAHAKPDAIVMHPGPMNRGVEIDGTIADDINRSVIQEQVEMGVAVRMAAMDLLAQNARARRAPKEVMV